MFHIRLQKSQSSHNSGIFSSPCGDFTGGEGEIWTLAPVTRPTPLAGAPLRPLEYFSIKQSFAKLCFASSCAYLIISIRRCLRRILLGGEGGIRTHGSYESLVFKTSSLNHSDTSPNKPSFFFYYNSMTAYCQVVFLIFGNFPRSVILVRFVNFSGFTVLVRNLDLSLRFKQINPVKTG